MSSDTHQLYAIPLHHFTITHKIIISTVAPSCHFGLHSRYLYCMLILLNMFNIMLILLNILIMIVAASECSRTATVVSGAARSDV